MRRVQVGGSLIELMSYVKPGCPVVHSEFQLVVKQGCDGVYSLVNQRLGVYYPAANVIELLQMVGTSYCADSGWCTQC